MIIDTSAVVAIVHREPEASEYIRIIGRALASITNEPLLFKGDDFGHTDVHPVL